MYTNTPEAIVVVTPPSGECVTVEEAKLQTRVDSGEEDDLIASYIKSAREQFEHLTQGRVVLTTTFRESIARWTDLFPVPPFRSRVWARTRPIKLHRAPVTEVTSIQFYDTNDALQTLDPDDYLVDADCTPALITFKRGVSYPALSPNVVRPIRITYEAGNLTTGEVPESIRDGIRSLVAYLYWNRESHTDSNIQAAPLRFQDVCNMHHTGLWGI